MRNRTEIDNNILGIDVESEGNEYKNVIRKKVEKDSSIEGQVQRNIQKQKREDKISSSADRQNKLPQTLYKRSVSVSNEIGQSEDTSIEDKIMGRDNDSKQSSNQRTGMVLKENRRQSTRVIDQQNSNMHVNNRRITTGLGSNADIRQSNRISTTRLIKRKKSTNNLQCQGNQNYLLRATSFRASFQEDARSGSFDTFRQHNSSLRYWEMESEGIPDRKNKTSNLPSEKTSIINRNNQHPRKIELNNRLILETAQMRRLHADGRNDLNDLQDMELHATDRHIRNTVQQTNQQRCDSRSQQSGDTHPQRVQLQMEQSHILHHTVYASKSGFKESNPAPSDLTYPLAESSKALHYPSGESTLNSLIRIVISRNLFRLSAPHKADLHSPLRID
ncbi:MAG: hypothetical protein EZS28_003288 [Streblomastix strix]|uniref:Uncharacterized protein n=1 Tax=Streblomastix strix TaxID=222440 RepID=A0A5J4X340_9EUKA|nr:MAG: hypothetical protein EZS28_003288 [Streblomastix strix]